MRRRAPIIAAVCLAALFPGASPALAVSGDLDSDPPDNLALVCSGTLRADGTESSIDARGTLDLAAGRMSGFGIGKADVVLVTPTTVGFDTNGKGAARLAALSQADVRPRSPATITQGTFQRQTGDLHIVVSSGRDPKRTLMDMDLTCRMEPVPRLP